MPDTDQRCPDCGVTMEAMKLRSGGGYNLQFVSDETREGILGKLGMNQQYDAETHVCPECGLSRTYADLEED
jgi:rubredoxin